MNELLKIPCPQCSNPIEIETQLLLSGAQFNCTQCQASIGLAEESKPVVEASYNALEELKNNSL